MAKIIAEGDSWFVLSKWKKYKVVSLKIFGIKRTDVIKELEELGYDIERVADSGDRIEEMADSEDQFKEIEKKLQKLDEPPLAILFSGGGNDIQDSLKTMLNNKNSSTQNSNPLNENEVKNFINRLSVAYRNLLTKINNLCAALSYNTKIPVLIHGYAYSVPNGYRFGHKKSEGNLSFALLGDVLFRGELGPWLQPIFKKKGYAVDSDLAEMACIMKKLANYFNDMLKAFDPYKNAFPKIYVQHVDLRQCWVNKLDNDYQKYWDDEFHPSEKGFQLIAAEFDKVIQNLTPIQVQDY